MSAKLPYLTSPGRIKTVLEKIIEAKTPERFTQDFLETKLGQKGGSARPVIPLLKRIGFLQSDGSTTELYKKFRNSSTQQSAMAKAIRHGYSELFDRNEYAHEFNKSKLLELVCEVSGAEKGNKADEYTASTFINLKEYADFEETEIDSEEHDPQPDMISHVESTPARQPQENPQNSAPLALSYSINLHLPETDDIKVFNAIFKSLNENILKR